MIKCAKQGCSEWVFLRPESELYCSTHKKGPGCLSMIGGLLLACAINLLMFMVLVKTVPLESPDGTQLCWNVDFAWPWEDQASNVLACIPATKRQHSELFPNQ